MPTTRKRKVGRPTDYDPKYCQQVIDHMAEGYPLETFSVKLGIDRNTIYNWAEKHPEFFRALMRGREASYKWWMDQGRKAVTGKVKGFSAGVWAMAMNNMFKWKDQQTDPLAMIAARAESLVTDKKELNEQQKLEYAYKLRAEVEEFIASRRPILEAKAVGLDKDALDERARDDVGKLPVALSDLKR